MRISVPVTDNNNENYNPNGTENPNTTHTTASQTRPLQDITNIINNSWTQPPTRTYTIQFLDDIIFLTDI